MRTQQVQIQLLLHKNPLATDLIIASKGQIRGKIITTIRIIQLFMSKRMIEEIEDKTNNLRGKDNNKGEIQINVQTEITRIRRTNAIK